MSPKLQALLSVAFGNRSTLLEKDDWKSPLFWWEQLRTHGSYRCTHQRGSKSVFYCLAAQIDRNMSAGVDRVVCQCQRLIDYLPAAEISGTNFVSEQKLHWFQPHCEDNKVKQFYYSSIWWSITSSLDVSVGSELWLPCLLLCVGKVYCVSWRRRSWDHILFTNRKEKRLFIWKETLWNRSSPGCAA